jgi:methyl-accepting chemotaxis protein
MDQMTQQNGAMVGETSEASRRLAKEADMLLGLVQQFKIDSQRSMARQDSRAA